MTLILGEGGTACDDAPIAAVNLARNSQTVTARLPPLAVLYFQFRSQFVLTTPRNCRCTGAALASRQNPSFVYLAAEAAGVGT